MIENNEEQLLGNDVNLDAGTQNENIENEKLNKDLLTGSSKFKSTEELLKAYENLEKEFTKKCQKLSALSGDNKTDANKNETVLPQYEREDWLKKTSKFLAENENAKNYVKQIAEILMADEDLAKKEDALELAYSKVLKQNFVTKEQLASDEDFLNEFVYKNEKIKNTIIKNYLLDIQSGKEVPLIGGGLGTNSVLSSKFSPKDLTEAGKFALHILKK